MLRALLLLLAMVLAVPAGAQDRAAVERQFRDWLENTIKPKARQAGVSAATLDRMQEIWNRAGLADVETQIIDMTVAFTDFGEFWRSNVVSTGPLGKALNNLNADETAKLQAVLRDRLSPNGAEAISYRAFANAVKGRVAS